LSPCGRGAGGEGEKTSLPNKGREGHLMDNVQGYTPFLHTNSPLPSRERGWGRGGENLSSEQRERGTPHG
ncbi:MAG: hypothetical protein ABW109_18320, partial [Candidatus Thiodiazotropha sp. 6PLUC4]